MSKKAQTVNAAPVQQTVSLTVQVGNILGLKKEEWEWIPTTDQLSAVQQQLARPATPQQTIPSPQQASESSTAATAPTTSTTNGGGGGDNAMSAPGIAPLESVAITTKISSNPNLTNHNTMENVAATVPISVGGRPMVYSKATEEERRVVKTMQSVLQPDLSQSLLFIYSKLYIILVKDLKLTPQQTQIIMALFKYVHDYLQDVEGFKQKLFALHPLAKLKPPQYAAIIDYAIVGLFELAREVGSKKSSIRASRPMLAN